MKRALAAALLALTLPAPAPAQDGKGAWKPFRFSGNERYEYKVVMDEDGRPKESGYILEVRKADGETYDVTSSTRTRVKAADLGQEALFGTWQAGASPALLLMNPAYQAFLEQVELKEGAKTDLFGAGSIKVGAKETVGGRTGLPCRLYLNQEGQETLVWAWTVDPALALPIRSVTYEEGKEKFRADLVSFKKD